MRKSQTSTWVLAAVVALLCGCSRTATSTPGGNQASPSSSSSSPSSAPQKAAPPQPQTAVIDAGTLLTVTLDQTISTQNNSSGDQFAASLAEPVMVQGMEIFPRGTRATGTVVQATAAGRLKGGALLALSLDSLTLNGEKVAIETSEFEEAGKGRGKRTLIGGGGGAAFGAIVGALAGGGKGAAIGALAGGGAGTAGAAFTGKRDITIPAETRLHFRLTKPLTMTR